MDFAGELLLIFKTLSFILSFLMTEFVVSCFGVTGGKQQCLGQTCSPGYVFKLIDFKINNPGSVFSFCRIDITGACLSKVTVI